jgi:carboxypeptidase Taq
MSEKFDQLRTMLSELSDIGQSIAVLYWDRETHMPPGGAEYRANQIATLTKIYHARFTSDEMGRLLHDLASEQKAWTPTATRSA